MNAKDLESLYRDALSNRLKNMGFSDYIADFEASRILKRWTKEQ